MLRWLLFSFLLLVGCHPSVVDSSTKDRAPTASVAIDGTTDSARLAPMPTLELPEGVDLWIEGNQRWARFSSTLPLSREIALTDHLRNTPGGRFGPSDFTPEMSRLIAERPHHWWVAGISRDALDAETYHRGHTKYDPSLAPLEVVRAFLVSPDFTTWANEVGVHLHLPLDRPEDRELHHVVVNRRSATGSLTLHRSIRSLIVRLCDLTDNDVEALIQQLPRLKNLERVRVEDPRGCGHLNAVIEALPRAKLRDIYLSGDPTPLAAVAGSFPALTHLTIHYQVPFDVRDAVIDSTIPTPLRGLSRSKSLEFLRLIANPVRRAGFLYGDDGFEEITACENLRSLEIRNSGVTDVHASKLAGMKNLEMLDVSHFDADVATTAFGTFANEIPGRLTDNGIMMLSKSQSLRRLAVSGHPVTPSSPVFADWDNLTHLTIFGQPSADYRWLAQMKSLRVLIVGGMTQADLASVAQSDSLEYIHLDKQLTLELVNTVKGMERLEAFGGRWTRIDHPSHLHEAAPDLFLFY